jgi:hypothetical protein
MDGCRKVLDGKQAAWMLPESLMETLDTTRITRHDINVATIHGTGRRVETARSLSNPEFKISHDQVEVSHISGHIGRGSCLWMRDILHDFGIRHKFDMQKSQANFSRQNLDFDNTPSNALQHN